MNFPKNDFRCSGRLLSWKTQMKVGQWILGNQLENTVKKSNEDRINLTSKVLSK